MHNPTPTIELSSRPTTSNLQHQYNELPEEDEKSSQELQITTEASQSSQSKSSVFSKIFPSDVERARKIFILLIICINVIEIPPLLLMTSSNMNRDSIEEWKSGSILRPLRFMSQNLKADPIMDIQIMDHGSTCPSGFHHLKLVNWPGTVAGCLCRNGYLKRMSCTEASSKECTIDFPSTDPIEMYEWDGSIFCIKRAILGSDYLKRAECPPDYKECYPGGCFKGECPITKLEIASKGTMTNKFTNKDKYLKSTRTSGELPLINIQMTLGDIPCWTQDLATQNLANSSYKLSTVRENECGKYGLNSQFTTRLDSQIAFDSFTENSFPTSVMHLPRFEENFNSTFSVLSSMIRMKTAKNDYCLEIDEKSTKDFFDYWPTKLSCICAVFLLTSQLIIFIFRLNLMCEHSRTEEVKQHLMYCLFGSAILSHAQIIVETIWYFNLYLPFQVMKEDIQRKDSLGCFVGSQGQIILTDYLESVKMIEGSFSWYLVVILLNILPSIAWIWYYNAKKRLAYKWCELLDV